MEDLKSTDNVWFERINGALAQSRATSSENLETVLNNLNKLLSEGYMCQEAMIQSFKTILSSARTVQENANLFSKETNDLIPLLKQMVEKHSSLSSLQKTISVNPTITWYVFKDEDFTIKYNFETQQMVITPAVPSTDLIYWKSAKEVLKRLPKSYLYG